MVGKRSIFLVEIHFTRVRITIELTEFCVRANMVRLSIYAETKMNVAIWSIKYALECENMQLLLQLTTKFSRIFTLFCSLTIFMVVVN